MGIDKLLRTQIVASMHAAYKGASRVSSKQEKSECTFLLEKSAG